VGVNVVSVDAPTLLLICGLLTIGIVLAAFALAWLYLAWRSASRRHQRARTESETLRQEQEMARAAYAHDLQAKQAELTALHA